MSLFMLMGTRKAVGILINSPIYKEATLKERKLIVTDFMKRYTDIVLEDRKNDLAPRKLEFEFINKINSH